MKILTLSEFEEHHKKVQQLLSEIAEIEQRIELLRIEIHLKEVQINELQEAQNEWLEERWEANNERFHNSRKSRK